MSHSISKAQITILSDAGRIPAVASVALAFAVVVTKWDTRRKTRKHLAALPPHLLQDVGLDPMSAATETAKPFWVG